MEIFFQGYSTQRNSQKAFLCEACGIESRGKFVLQKLEHSQDFSCTMGKRGKCMCLMYDIALVFFWQVRYLIMFYSWFVFVKVFQNISLKLAVKIPLFLIYVINYYLLA